ncbi:MAG: DUF885 family protein [Woeseia sp.]|nr:DUF885 family protein [Woeseia sp.]
MSKRHWKIVSLWAAIAFAFPTLGLTAGSSYDDLVQLFNEFREFQEAEIVNGIPDYTPAAVEKQFLGLKERQSRLAAIDSAGWPVWQQVDYHLVRAEMNALEFHHKVHKPWARDPGFYSMMGGDAGATIQSRAFFEPIFALFEAGEDGAATQLSLDEDQRSALQATLQAIPDLYAQAKTNLTEPAADFAEFAIRNFERERSLYEDFAVILGVSYPDLARDSRYAAVALEDYREWLAEQQSTMAEYAGLGKDNYDWWMHNVQLSPWGWEESNQIIQTEYSRVITFLKMEEQRNRNLPPLEVTMSRKDWDESLRVALHHVVDYMRDNEIMTMPDWVDPSDYYSMDMEGFEEPVYEKPSEDFLPENTSIDTKVRQREILPGETHEYIGHMLDYQRQERLTQSPIRSAERRFNMGSMRLEGWAVALEELMMQAGVLDDRPRKGREMEYLMNASHMSLAIPDMEMHANHINLTEGRQLCAEIMPRGWSQEDEGMVWFEMQSNLRNPGGFHSNVLTGKAYFMKLFRERAQAMGDDFVIRGFVDEFLASGTIPMSLIRWETTGDSSDVILVAEPL